MALVAILWQFSMAISNVQGAVTKGLLKICVYSRKTSEDIPKTSKKKASKSTSDDL